MSFSHQLRVRYQETDQQGIVYHSRYLEYLDIAMLEFFRALGWSFQDLNAINFDPSLVETTVKFHAAARFDEEIEIYVAPLRVGNSSFTLQFSILQHSNSQLLLNAHTTYVNIDAKKMTSVTIPQKIRQKLIDLVETEKHFQTI